MPVREIAEGISRGLKVPVVAMSPEEAAGHFGPLALFAGMDTPASSVLTQQRLGWRPTPVDGWEPVAVSVEAGGLTGLRFVPVRTRRR